jgi:hypothetical protein
MWVPVIPQHFEIQTQDYDMFWWKMVVTPKVAGANAGELVAGGEFLSQWSFGDDYYQYMSQGQTKLHMSVGVSILPRGFFTGGCYAEIWAGDGSGQHWFIEEDYWAECTFCVHRQRIYKINGQGWGKPEIAIADITIAGGFLWYYGGAYGSIRDANGAKVGQLSQGSTYLYGLAGYPAWEVTSQDVFLLPGSTLAAITVMLEMQDIETGGYYAPWFSFIWWILALCCLAICCKNPELAAMCLSNPLTT